MAHDPYTMSDDYLCSRCAGSGEGRYDGTTCDACYGTGSADEARRRREDADAREDYYADQDRFDIHSDE